MLALHLLHGHAPLVPTLVFTVLAAGTVAVAPLVPPLVRRIKPKQSDSRTARLLHSSLDSLGSGVRDAGLFLRPGHVRVVAGAMGYLAFDIAAFAVAFAAFGPTPPLGALVFAYVIGQLGGVIPLPGGIGGTDGGLIGAMVLYGSPLSQAAAAVVVYRTFQLGVPAVLGTIAFVQLRRTLRASPAPARMCAPLADPIPEHAGDG